MATCKPDLDASVVWEWQGQDAKGKRISGTVRAKSEVIARARVRRQGVHALRVQRRRAWFTGSIAERDITLFTRQLATLMRAGVPLLQAFDAASSASLQPGMVGLLLDIRGDIESGMALAQACRRYPRYFDALFCHSIAAGEAAGVLDVLLERLASGREKKLLLRRRIRAALIYPLIVLFSGVGVAAIILMVVVPAFRELFVSLGAELPLPTQFVLWLTDQLFAWRWVLFSVIVAGITSLYQAWQRIPVFRAQWDRLVLTLPIIGAVLQKAMIARWARTLATLLAVGVPLAEALEPVGRASGNQVFAHKTLTMVADLGQGMSLNVVLERSQLFPSMVLQMITIGEESGLLGDMLDKVADFYESEVDNVVMVLPNLIEPVIMIILGILVGGLVFVMYLPLFNIGHLL